ncbi:hypothetical protein [Brevundimonas sp.]|uniref:hypothetical protein n=1 Tax=Brevundimonas sp. TaxID=1871086 RepID=UPI002D279AB6|nr:hypothetical protein [Brevundimonas sp.]HYC68889.1 hypothetical protein [Brevundimonas sp.]
MSAIATLFAGFVALAVPFVLEMVQAHGRRRAAEEALTGSVAEIVRAVKEALTSYSSVHVELSKSHLVGDYSLRFQDFGERGQRAAEVISLLVARPGLTDGAIRCGVEGAELGRQVNQAALEAAADLKANKQVALSRLLRNAVRARRLTRQIDRLISYHRVPNEVSETWPEIERAYLAAMNTGAFPDDAP